MLCLSKSLNLSWKNPLKLQRGDRQWATLTLTDTLIYEEISMLVRDMGYLVLG